MSEKILDNSFLYAYYTKKNNFVNDFFLEKFEKFEKFETLAE